MSKKDQEIPQEVIELQKERLSEKEFNFCRNLFEKITTMPYLSRKNKDNIIDYIKSQTKFECKIEPFDNSPKEFEIYNLFINNKNCYLVFDLINGAPPNIIPSGVILNYDSRTTI
jgi:hypothetical protein